MGMSQAFGVGMGCNAAGLACMRAGVPPSNTDVFIRNS